MGYDYRDVSPVYNKRDEALDHNSFYEVILGDSQNVLTRLEDTYDQEAIKNSLRNIFIIQKNQVPGKPWFGNPLETEIFELFGNVTESVALTAVENAIAKYEPRVEVDDLKVTFLPEYNRIVVDLRYYILQNDEKVYDNLLMPFSHNNFTFLDGRPQIEIK